MKKRPRKNIQDKPILFVYDYPILLLSSDRQKFTPPMTADRNLKEKLNVIKVQLDSLDNEVGASNTLLNNIIKDLEI